MGQVSSEDMFVRGPHEFPRRPQVPLVDSSLLMDAEDVRWLRMTDRIV